MIVYDEAACHTCNGVGLIRWEIDGKVEPCPKCNKQAPKGQGGANG